MYYYMGLSQLGAVWYMGLSQLGTVWCVLLYGSVPARRCVVYGSVPGRSWSVLLLVGLSQLGAVVIYDSDSSVLHM